MHQSLSKMQFMAISPISKSFISCYKGNTDIHCIPLDIFSDMIRNLQVHHATSNAIMVTWEPPQNNDVESYKVTVLDFQSPLMAVMYITAHSDCLCKSFHWNLPRLGLESFTRRGRRLK